MALFQCGFFSEVLGQEVNMNVILPRRIHGQLIKRVDKIQDKFPVLYLLHGFSGDHSTWLRRTSIERYVSKSGIAVIMPNAGHSFYTNTAYGMPYWDFISQELPETAASFFPLSNKREETFAAGISMGGFGALKLALHFPERFRAVASLSGALALFDTEKGPAAAAPSREEAYFIEQARHIFGGLDKIPGSDDDLINLIQNKMEFIQSKPALYLYCGKKDSLYPVNLKIKKLLEQKGISFVWEDDDGGHHWEYWDPQIKKVITWISSLL